jgi:4-hydroxy-2-oxoglutarate aldolase
MKVSVDLAGVFLPVTTPFDAATGDVDVESFRSNLVHWFRHPIAGVLIGGTNGEGTLLDDAELESLVETAVAVAPKSAKVLAWTGAESTRRATRLARAAASVGAQAVLVSPPAFFKVAMTPEALSGHYHAVADASTVPVLIYQVPTRMSTVDMTTGLIAELSQHENIVGIKDSRGKLEILAELVAECRRGFQVLVGNGALLYPALETGAVGGVVAVGMIATEDAAAIPIAYRAGRKTEAARHQERLVPLHQHIVADLGIPGVKAALDLLGLYGGPPRSPLLPASTSTVDDVRRLLDTAGLLTTTRV